MNKYFVRGTLLLILCAVLVARYGPKVMKVGRAER